MTALSNLMKIFTKGFPRVRSKHQPLDPQRLQYLARQIVTARPVEIGCDECWNDLDRFAELQLAGKNAGEAMPLVEDHLERCGACREEYEALLDALKALA